MLAGSSKLATVDTDMRPTVKSSQSRCSFWSGRMSADRFEGHHSLAAAMRLECGIKG